jgi:hypothetical protein
MSLTQLRLDDQAYGAFIRDLEYKEQQVRKIMYPEKKGANPKYFPTETLSVPWAETSSFTLSDVVGGEFELADDRTTNLSMVEVTGEKVTQGIYQFRKGYEISEKEIARHLHLGIPIEERKIEAVQQLYINTLNRLVLFGHAPKQLPGILNHPAFLRMAAPYPLDETSNESQLLATLSAGGQAMWDASKQVHTPSTLLLPPAKFRYLTEQVRLGTSANDTTILQFFLKNNMSIKNIDYLAELEGAGPSGEDMALYYTRNPSHCVVRITDAMRYREYIKKPFGIQRPVAFDYNGIFAYQPYSVLLMYGI